MKEGSKGKGEENEEELKVRLPKRNEVIGIVTGKMGSSRFLVMCSDGKERLCRIPGGIKRDIWVKEMDYVLVEPWEIDDKRGDIIFKYSPTQVEWLKKRNYLKEF